MLKAKADKKVDVPSLFTELRKPPYGIRDGLIPFLFAIYIVAHRQDIAVFEDGTFLREVKGDDFLRLIKAPEYFEIQHSGIKDIRASVFDRLIKVLDIPQKSNERNTRILGVVQPLCTFAVQLPEYVHKTKKISQEAITVRDKLMSAREPAPLLFRDLPLACGLAPFDVTESIEDSRVQNFAEILKVHLGELQNAYTELLERLKYAIFEAFARDSDVKERNSLAKRAEALWGSVSEPQLKALCGRLRDDNLSEPKWIESVASFIVSNPPSYWSDSDETAFQHKLTEFAERFKHVESIYFGRDDILEGSEGIRLSITRADGSERAEVVYFRAETEKQLACLQESIQGLLTENGRLGLVALARTVWDELNQGSEETK